MYYKDKELVGVWGASLTLVKARYSIDKLFRNITQIKIIRDV